MKKAQLEIIALLADDLVSIAAEMRQSKLTRLADRIDRKARIIERLATDLGAESTTKQETAPCNSSN